MDHRHFRDALRRSYALTLSPALRGPCLLPAKTRGRHFTSAGGPLGKFLRSSIAIGKSSTNGFCPPWSQRGNSQGRAPLVLVLLARLPVWARFFLWQPAALQFYIFYGRMKDQGYIYVSMQLPISGRQWETQQSAAAKTRWKLFSQTRRGVQ